MLTDVINDLQKAADPKKAAFLNRFFKTGKGHYAEEDVFTGITVPVQREIASRHKDLSLEEIRRLLKNPIHEYRLTALFFMIDKFKKADPEEKKNIYELYLAHMKHINNWDLVDSSSPYIVGEYLVDKDRDILYQLAQSDDLWEKRIAMLATLAFIRRHDFNDTLAIAELLVHEKHDLLQKAVGWMLREMGKKDIAPLEHFLQKHHKTMPRTMLRYAIEKLDQKKKNYYMGRTHE